GDAYEVTQAPGPFQFAQAGPPPQDQAITASGTTISATEGVAFTDKTVATFTDPDQASTAAEYSATIDWGDGSSSSGTVAQTGPGSFDVRGSHTYTEEKTYA